jgi:tRNA1Val (adenine37-N6)-methyltransferase
MKVCTDSCLFGSWVQLPETGRVLDIGTGTGLLALIAAQRQPEIEIEALEIDRQAAAQASENVQKSPWGNRIQVLNVRLQEFIPTAAYHAILCNPPFFTNSLLSKDSGEQMAKHQLSLSFSDIVEFAACHLLPDGMVHILLPPAEQEQFKKAAARQGLFPQEELWVRDRPGSAVFRVFISYTRSPGQLNPQELAIKDETGNYSTAFRELLRDFYLAF